MVDTGGGRGRKMRREGREKGDGGSGEIRGRKREKQRDGAVLFVVAFCVGFSAQQISWLTPFISLSSSIIFLDLFVCPSVSPCLSHPPSPCLSLLHILQPVLYSFLLLATAVLGTIAIASPFWLITPTPPPTSPLVDRNAIGIVSCKSDLWFVHYHGFQQPIQPCTPRLADPDHRDSLTPHSTLLSPSQTRSQSARTTTTSTAASAMATTPRIFLSTTGGCARTQR